MSISDAETPRDRAERYIDVQKRKEALGQAYQRAFDSPEGKMVLKDLLARCGIFESDAAEPPHMWPVRLGRRSIGVEIIDQLRWSEMEILALSRERTAEQIARATEE